MGQVNVNAGGSNVPPEESSGMGMLLGILVAIVVIALLVWILFISPGNTAPQPTDNGNPQASQSLAPASEPAESLPAETEVESAAPTTSVEASPSG